MLEHPHVRARTALEYMTARGWQPEARSDPLNTVRTALCHLASWGEVERIKRGVYRLAIHERKPIPSLADGGGC